MLQDLLGGRAAQLAVQQGLRALSDVAYAAASAVAGSSLGEEYSELLLVSGLRPVKPWRRLLAAALRCVGGGEWMSMAVRLHLASLATIADFRPLLEHQSI